MRCPTGNLQNTKTAFTREGSQGFSSLEGSVYSAGLGRITFSFAYFCICHFLVRRGAKPKHAGHDKNHPVIVSASQEAKKKRRQSIKSTPLADYWRVAGRPTVTRAASVRSSFETEKTGVSVEAKPRTTRMKKCSSLPKLEVACVEDVSNGAVVHITADRVVPVSTYGTRDHQAADLDALWRCAGPPRNK